MRTLLVAATVVAILAAIASTAAARLIMVVAVFVVVMFVLPVCLATLAVYSRGYQRTFFAGALAGSFTPYFLMDALRLNNEVNELLGITIAVASSSVSCGFAALMTRRFVERRGWHLPPSEPRDQSPR